MCGIAGLFSTNYQDRNIILSLTNTLKHRGPDDEGYIAVDTENLRVFELIGDDSVVKEEHIKDFKNKANLFLGHRRLSIIDPTPAGHQPMANDDGSLWIIFNGEIYNYIEIREVLKSKGHRFRTATDTEVIIKAYEEWGFDCLHRFNGMWAFVILDLEKKILFGSRDRFGVKPLYYYWDNQNFAFASEIKALLKLPFYNKDINEKAVFDYLVLNLEEYDDESFFKNIIELKPAHYFILEINSKNFVTKKYYDLKYLEQFEDYNEKKLDLYLPEIKKLIIDSVNLRLRSDVPVGTCLSGGLDSSTVACVINSFLKEKNISQIGEQQKVFTACYVNNKIDETKWAEIVVNKTNAKWFKTFPSGEELLEDLEDLIYYQEIPFGSTSIYAQYRVMKLAKESGVKVLLDGQGGDELFAGYHTYYKVFLAELISKGRFKSALSEFREIRKSGARPIEGVIKNLFSPFIPYSLKNAIGNYKYPFMKYLNENFSKKFKNRLFIEENSNNLNEFLFKHMTYLNLKTLLKYEDRNSMRFSIEARTPFADDINLIEYVFKIPSSYKIHNGWTKYLMRKAMQGVLPEEIQWRRDKIGFATPENEWLRKNSKAFQNSLTKDLQDFLDIQNIFDEWEKMISTRNSNLQRFVWRLINFNLWYKKYIKIKR